MQRNINNGRRYFSNGGNGRGGSHYANGDVFVQNFLPPPEWRDFTELKFKISNVSYEADINEIRKYFDAFGKVYKIQMETTDFQGSEDPTGVVYIVYKLV
jgi:hypothetical protein